MKQKIISRKEVMSMESKWNTKKFPCRASVVVLLVYLSAMMLTAAERTITVAAVGDCIITRRLSPYTEERFLKLMELLRKADVAYANMEGTVHDKKGYPAPKGGDMNLISEPFIADELAWAGFDMMGMANNHAMDYLAEGLLATQANLDRVGIMHAGTGRNLEEASAPAYFDSKNGRIALINFARSAPDWSLASSTRGDVIGRPGLNPLRTTTTFQVPASDLEALKKISNELIPPRDGYTPPSDDIFNFLRLGRFKAGPKPETIVELNKEDLKRITDAVKKARQDAHIVMVTVHDHRQGAALEQFARACIDAGADCFFGAGPHRLAALEIYSGKPIFYSLGNFIFQYRTVKQIPAEVYESQGDKLDNIRSSPIDFYRIALSFNDEMYWTSVVPWIVFSEGKLKEIVMHPVTLNYGADWADPLGRPLLADEETGKRIIDKMISLSDPYGTKIVYKEGKGIVQIN
jgi:poly-gamma-glutamate synthesis protein (capsule biosynthesis protein)